jgi:hypothetical protein
MASAIGKGLIAAVVLTAGVSAAQADEQDTRGSVTSRPRPAYDAVGVHAGGFTVFPSATVSEKYDDNIYATDTNTTDDFITALGAAVDVNSNWSRHALNFTSGVTQYIYADNSDENRLDWNVGVDGRLDVTRDTQVAANMSYSQLHEDRGDPNSPAAAVEPTEYTLFDAGGSVSQHFNRLLVKVNGGYSNYNYDDVLSTAGTVIDQDDRDRVEYVEGLRLGYDVSPDTNVYVEGTLNQRNYDTSPLPTNRDSDGYSVVAGSEFRLSNLAQGSIYGGYQSQSYDDSALYPSVDGLRYGADVEWYATALTTVTFTADSSIQETTTGGASGFLSQSVGVRVDHELLRNVLLNGSLGYTDDDYTGISRTDDTVRAGLGLKYLLNRNLSLGLGYDYTDKDSDAAGNDYTRNVVGVTLTGQL